MREWKLLRFSLLLLCLQYSRAWETFVPLAKGQEQCVTSTSKYDLGDDWYDDNRCIKYSCGGAPKNLVVNVEGCPTQNVVDRRCYPQPKRGRYPNCCPNIVCIDN